MLPQLIGMNFSNLRRLFRWMFQATSSFPVPDAPLMRILTSLFAYFSIDSFSWSIGFDSPMSLRNSSRLSTPCISVRSAFSERFSSFFFSYALKMLSMKSVGW